MTMRGLLEEGFEPFKTVMVVVVERAALDAASQYLVFSWLPNNASPNTPEVPEDRSKSNAVTR